MSVPTIRTPRSPFSRSARRSAAVPGAPEAVTRTVMSRIAAAMLVRRDGRAGEEEADAVPAADLATVRSAEMRAGRVAAEAARDECLLRTAVDLRAGRASRRRGERALQRSKPRARRGTVEQRPPDRRAAQCVVLHRRLSLAVRPHRDVE